MATRRLRIVKYRGSTHGTSEYPFLIDEDGISILPISSMGLTHQASTERVSSGVPRLDAMMGGKGYYRGSSVLVSGTAGTGKTSLAAHFAHASGFKSVAHAATELCFRSRATGGEHRGQRGDREKGNYVSHTFIS